MARTERKLTDKQLRFVDEYLVDLNATQAAIRAGYSPKTANNSVGRLLVNAGIQAAIQERKGKRQKRLEITQDRVVRELARIAFSDIRSYAEWGADGVTLKESADLDDDQAAALAEVGQSVTRSGDQIISFKTHSKLKALDLLMQHLGDKVLEGEEHLSADQYREVLSEAAAQAWAQEASEE